MTDNVRDFVMTELERVNDHVPVIYDTRDRFFSNFMTVALAVFGFIGFISKEPSTSGSAIPFALFTLIALLILGVGTLCLVTGNWLARDFYRQRRKRLQRLLLEATDAQSLRDGMRDYFAFTRDRSTWHFRISSIYFIYNTAIAATNSIAAAFAYHLVSPLRLRTVGVVVVVLISVQHLACVGYLWVYRRRRYQE